MPKTFTINGATYNFPVQGDSPPWGDNLTGTISALVDVANTFSGTGDILVTSFTVANNQSSVANITGLNFDPSAIRSAVVNYSIYRSSNTTELSEAGTIWLTYKTTAATWEIANVSVGNAGVTITITNAGQLQYVSTDIGATSYTSKMKFSAKAYTTT